MPATATTICHAAAIRDAHGLDLRDAAVAIASDPNHAPRILAVGPPARLADAYPDARHVDRSRSLILPAMVNAHAHLDLTDLGPSPFKGSFIDWVQGVIRDRPTAPDAIAHAVRRGLAMSRQSGVAWIGDIAGSDDAANARLTAPPGRGVAGVSFLECFGLGGREPAAVAEMGRRFADVAAAAAEPAARAHGASSLGLQPHAPYSAGRSLFDAAAALSPVNSTHLAETQAELAFVHDADGPFADLLRRIGKWDDAIAPRGVSPVRWLEPTLMRSWWILAHCNYVSDDDIALLARANGVVAYCPVASEYFGHHGHRYRDMLDAGVRVCLGTDSILCQPPGEPQPMAILPQMRRLFRRDATDPLLLLRMATTPPLRDAQPFAVAPGAPADLIAIDIDPDDPRDPLVQALSGDNPCTPISFKE